LAQAHHQHRQHSLAQAHHQHRQHSLAQAHHQHRQDGLAQTHHQHPETLRRNSSKKKMVICPAAILLPHSDLQSQTGHHTSLSWLQSAGRCEDANYASKMIAMFEEGYRDTTITESVLPNMM
jgi:hypothetical protein